MPIPIPHGYYNISLSPEYRAIAFAYGDKKAERSGVLYIRHIAEGLTILDRIGASDLVQKAYCLHPLVQNDADLRSFIANSQHYEEMFGPFDASAVALAMEYRAVANASLSTRTDILDDPSKIDLGPLPEVAQMLIADKVQNRKDFEKYNKDKHPRSSDLDRYFKAWMIRLGISEERYAELIKDL